MADMLDDREFLIALGNFARGMSDYVDESGAIKDDRATLAQFVLDIFTAAEAAVEAYVRMTPTTWDDVVFNMVRGPLGIARMWLAKVLNP